VSVGVRLDSTLAYVRTHRGEIARFVLVGAATFALNFVTFHVAFALFGFGYKMATSVAYAVTVTVHFLLNRFFTFNAGDSGIGMHAGRYALMLLLNYGITLAIVWFVVEVLRISPYYGPVAATAATALSSFFVMKYFVFGWSEARG
jgi:putative flippase GtrA